MHLCQKYKPTKLRLRDEEAEKQQRRAEFDKDVLEDSDWLYNMCIQADLILHNKI